MRFASQVQVGDRVRLPFEEGKDKEECEVVEVRHKRGLVFLELQRTGWVSTGWYRLNEKDEVEMAE